MVMLKHMLIAVIQPTHVTIARYKKRLWTVPKTIIIAVKSAPNNINNANLYKVSGFKSSLHIWMKRCNSKVLCLGHDVKFILDQS